MKSTLFFIISIVSFFTFSQCNQFFIYESFSATLPTQGGTWINTSVLYGSTAATIRTGTHYLSFNAVNDAMRLPQIANPGVLSFYYRRSSTSTGTPKFSVETSTDGSVWTERLAVTSFSTTYALATVNLGALGLSSIHIRIIDKRASGTAERYIDDLTLTSTSATSNTLLTLMSSCSQTLSEGGFFNISDNGGPSSSGGYSHNVNRVLTIAPPDNTKKVTFQFWQMNLETGYDSLYVYDGPTVASPLILAATGTTIPGVLTATGTGGELTLKWITDASNIGTWGGFLIEAATITPLPVELIQFETVGYPKWNVVKWATASEHNSSHFDLQLSLDAEIWKTIATKTAAGNSTTEIKYSWIDYNSYELTYYKLIQYDIDGAYEEFGPIVVYKSSANKTVVKYINLMGQDIDPLTTTGLVIEVYDDGTIRKLIR